MSNNLDIDALQVGNEVIYKCNRSCLTKCRLKTGYVCAEVLAIKTWANISFKTSGTDLYIGIKYVGDLRSLTCKTNRIKIGDIGNVASVVERERVVEFKKKFNAILKLTGASFKRDEILLI